MQSLFDGEYFVDNKEPRVIDPTENEYIDFTYSITSYGADYPVDSLVSRLRKNKIRVPTFQRSFVWSERQASGFIESLLLGLPVPGIFLCRDVDSADLLVIDGQQRLRSLLFFYDGLINGKSFKLCEVQPRFEGKTYKTLDPDDRQRLDDSIIHATVVRQDEPSDDNSSIYILFKRLNSGGMLLQPQEIRTAIYQGKFAELLKSLNEFPAWREIYGKRSTRLKDQEFILRFFALNFFRQNYKKPLQSFLNSYMAKNKNLGFTNEETLTQAFEITTTFIAEALGKRAFRPFRAINASILDSVMVGVSEMLGASTETPDKEKFIIAYDALLKNPDYLHATSKGTSDEPVVERRMEIAIKAFMDIL